jgi:hypothetical protein
VAEIPELMELIASFVHDLRPLARASKSFKEMSYRLMEKKIRKRIDSVARNDNIKGTRDLRSSLICIDTIYLAGGPLFNITLQEGIAFATVSTDIPKKI